MIQRFEPRSLSAALPPEPSVSLPLRFLHSLSQAFSSSTLYSASHPARQRAVRSAYDTLRLLQAEDDHPSFSFLGRDVIYGYDAVRELRDWDWSARLAAAGIQRIEIAGDVTRDDFEIFIEEILVRLTGGTAAVIAGATSVNGGEQVSGAPLPPPPRQLAIRFGAIGVQGAAKSSLNSELPKGNAEFTLREEASTIRYIHAEVTESGSVPMAEAEAVIRSLSVALHSDGRILIPLLRMKSFDQYTTTHSINVAVLTMALAEAMGHSPRDVRTLGVAGLLHDLGKVRVPPEILTKPGSLSPEERELLERHPGDGARLILNSDSKLTVPAAVAWEHHIMINGGGYPHRHFARECHYASTIVHVCDVFDALHTDRPYRDAWPAAKALHYIERRAGREFDPIITAAFIALMRKNERGVGIVDEQTPVGPSAEGGPPNRASSGAVVVTEAQKRASSGTPVVTQPPNRTSNGATIVKTGTPTGTPAIPRNGTPTSTTAVARSGTPSGVSVIRSPGTPTSVPTIPRTGTPSSTAAIARTGTPASAPAIPKTDTPTNTPTIPRTATPNGTSAIGTPETPTSDPAIPKAAIPIDLPTSAKVGTPTGSPTIASPVVATAAPPVAPTTAQTTPATNTTTQSPPTSAATAGTPATTLDSALNNTAASTPSDTPTGTNNPTPATPPPAA